MKSQKILALVLIPAMLAACGPLQAASLIYAAGTPTPTPFLPQLAAAEIPEDQQIVSVQEQPQVQEGSVIDYGDFAPPSEPSDIEIPPPLGAIPQPEGQINILLLGSDQRPTDGGFRTDVIELLTINTADNTVSLTSFPRDLYVYEPGWRVTRINAAMQHGGFEMMADTMAYNFGVKPDHYALINFQGFESIVDILGGINVEVAQGLTDHRDGHGDYSVGPGTVWMDGETALWYVRSRGTSSDFERTRRQQEVLTAIFFRLLSLNAIANATDLYNQYKQLVQTDMGLTDILPLLPLALNIDSDHIHNYSIGRDQVESHTTSGGGAVLLPLQDFVRQVMKQALNAPE